MEHIDARAEEIKKMILKMGTGNFSYRIPRSAENTQTESIIALLNMLAQEFEVAYNPFFGTSPFTTITRIKHYIFMLDQQYRILQTNFDADNDRVLEKQNFLNLLSPASQEVFQKLLKTPKKKGKTLNGQLELKADKKLLMPLNCSVFPLRAFHPDSGLLVVLSRIQTLNPLLHGKQQEKQEYPVQQLKVLKSSEDIHKFREIAVYLHKHLDRPLGSLKEIASAFNINEFKLKKGFKELHQTTVFKYHLQLRLSLALQLVLDTSDQLASIAWKTGFKNYDHFAQAFKREFGVAPSHYRKQK